MSAQLKVQIKQPQVGVQINQPQLGVNLKTPVREVYSGGDYEKLVNIPSIEGIPLKGNKTFPQLNLQSLSNTELENLLTL